MGQFTYWYVLVILLFEVITAIASLVYFLKYYRSPPHDWFGRKTYNSVSRSCHGDTGSFVLLFTRLGSFFWFIAVGLVVLHTEHPTSWNYFTVWNGYLLVLYFGLASVASISHIFGNIFSDSCVLSNGRIRTFSAVVSILFEIAGSSAIFVTFVNFTLLSAEIQFLNLSLHGTTSVCQVVELLQNDIKVELPDIIFVISWPCLYLLFITPIVMLSVRDDYPYDFLHTDTPYCFVWYNGLFLILLGFFGIWHFLSQMKYRFIVHKMDGDDSATNISLLGADIPDDKHELGRQDKKYHNNITAF